MWLLRATPVIASALQPAQKPVRLRIFSQVTRHYLYIESKRAMIYAHSKVIGLTGKRKTTIYDNYEEPGV